MTLEQNQQLMVYQSNKIAFIVLFSLYILLDEQYHIP